MYWPDSNRFKGVGRKIKREEGASKKTAKKREWVLIWSTQCCLATSLPGLWLQTNAQRRTRAFHHLKKVKSQAFFSKENATEGRLDVLTGRTGEHR